jgi:hypothetical protein
MNGYTARTTFSRRIAHDYSSGADERSEDRVHVTTTEGPSRVTIVTGTMPISLAAFGKPGNTTQRGSFKAVIDPSLTPGQFRGATSTVSFGAIMSSASLSSASRGVRVTEQWVLDDARATYDDGSGRVQLVGTCLPFSQSGNCNIPSVCRRAAVLFRSGSRTTCRART